MLICRKIISVPVEHVGGVEFVVAICPLKAEVCQVAQDKDCILLRCKSKKEVKAQRTHPHPKIQLHSRISICGRGKYTR
jgi:hypothetical protein